MLAEAIVSGGGYTRGSAADADWAVGRRHDEGPSLRPDHDHEREEEEEEEEDGVGSFAVVGSPMTATESVSVVEEDGASDPGGRRREELTSRNRNAAG